MLQDVPEIWEISYNPAADDVPIGMIHDFLYKEGARSYQGSSTRAAASARAHGPGLHAKPPRALGMSRQGGKSQVIHLDVRKDDRQPAAVRHASIRRCCHLELPSGAWHTGAQRDGPAQPRRWPGQGCLIWKAGHAQNRPMPGPGRLMRSHEGAPMSG